MKKYTLILLFNLIFLELNAQQVYFNNRYDIEQGLEGGSGILNTANGYITIGFSRTIDFSKRFLFIWEINKEGHTNWIKSHSYSPFFSSNSYGPNTNNDTNFYFVTGNFLASNGYKKFLFKINRNNGDSIWLQKFDYFDTTYTSYSSRAIEISGGNFFMAGADDKSGNPDIFLMKTDSLGNELWLKRYGGAGVENTTDMVITADGGTILCGRTEVSGIMKSIIIKTDSSGNIQWQRVYGGNQYNSGHSNVTLTSDGGYAVSYLHTNLESFGRGYGVIRLMKLNSHGNIQWQKDYLKNYNRFGDYEGSTYRISQLKDNSYLMVTTDARTGGLLKVSSTGDSLWYRTYRNVNPNADTTNISHNYLWDYLVDTLDNNSIVAVGQVFPVPPDTGTQDMWVIKLDSLGCPFAGCDTIGKIDDTSINNILVSDANIAVYPNPAHNSFIFEMLLTSPVPIKLSLWDYTGKQWLSETWHDPPAHVKKQLNISMAPPGLYFLRVEVNGKLFTRKIVKI
ncbi:MAG: T9SS type A sorting domain-containing protein [Bacteroidetes bacterium]|nr:T9SS type A sorting domain-containing protein [Bacteroidota bacterium]